MDEIWRDISGYEGYYQVSNFGNVRSVDRYVTQPMPQNNCNATRLLKGQPLKQTTKLYGYKVVEFNKNNRRKVHYVHRLVAEAFIDNPENKPQVNHKDYNPSNNNVNNLERVTHKENNLYSSERYSHPKNIINKTTGERYISKFGDRYKVNIAYKRIKVYRSKICNTLEEAILFRDKILTSPEVIEYARRQYVH